MRLRTLSVLGLCGGGRSSPSAELFTRRFAGPCARINIANDTQPLFGFRECREITHVQTETLAALLEAATHEERKTLQLFLVRLGKRHRRCRRAQIQNERSRVGSRRCRRITSVRTPDGARRQIWRRWCHNFPGPIHPSWKSPALWKRGSHGKGVLASRLIRDRGSPAVIGTSFL